MREPREQVSVAVERCRTEIMALLEECFETNRLSRDESSERLWLTLLISYVISKFANLPAGLKSDTKHLKNFIALMIAVFDDMRPDVLNVINQTKN